MPDSAHQRLVAYDRDAAALLTAHPGPYWTAPTAAALWDLSEEAAEQRLERLARQGLLCQDPDHQRYSMPDPVRTDLEQAARTRLLPGHRRACARLISYYAEAMVATDLAVEPQRWRWHPAATEMVRRTHRLSPDEAWTWIQRELPNLPSLVRLAHEQGHHAQTVAMAEACGVWDELLCLEEAWPILELGMTSAQSLDDGHAVAAMHLQIATWRLRRDHDDHALETAVHALALWAGAAPVKPHPYYSRGLAHLYQFISQIYVRHGRLTLADRYAHMSLQASAITQVPRDAAVAHYCQALANPGRSEVALALLRTSLHLLVDQGEGLWVSRVHQEMSRVLGAAGEFQSADEHALLAQEAMPFTATPGLMFPFSLPQLPVPSSREGQMC